MTPAHSPKAYKYDVAISCLNDDLGIAQKIREGLEPQVGVFLYATKQEEIAGLDGIDAFTSAFRAECNQPPNSVH